MTIEVKNDLKLAAVIASLCMVTGFFSYILGWRHGDLAAQKVIPDLMRHEFLAGLRAAKDSALTTPLPDPVVYKAQVYYDANATA